MNNKIIYSQMGRTQLRVYNNKKQLITKIVLRKNVIEAQAAVTEREVEPTETEKVELTTYRDQDMAVVQQGLYHVSSTCLPSDPYMSQFIQTLQRNYPVETFAWTGSQTAGTPVFTVLFPQALYNVPFIQQVLKRFRYMRAGVKFTVRINSTNFNSGSLLLTWLPSYNSTSPLYFDRRQTMFQASAQPNALISANKREVVEQIIPWIQPRKYWDMDYETQNLPQYQSLMGSVECFVQTPLKSNASTSVPSVDVSVFANFVDIEVAGMKIFAQSNFKGGSPLEEEAQQKSKAGSISNVCEKIGDIAGIFEASPFAEEAMFVKSVATTAKSIFTALGYSKTTERDEKLRFVPYTAGSFNLASGIGLNEKMSLYGENSVTKDHAEFGTTEDYDLVSKLIALPSLSYVSSFDANTLVGSRLFQFAVHPRLFDLADYQGYTKFMSNYSQFWTGSMKFNLKIYTSAFITTRVRVCWFPHEPPLVLDDLYAGDIVNQVLDINGDTDLCFTIPYLHHKTHLQCPVLTTNTQAEKLSNICNGYVAAYVVNKVVSSQPDASSYIGYAIWAAGGEDMRFTGVRGSRNVPLQWQAQADVKTTEGLLPRQLFKKVFAGLSPATCQIAVGHTMGEHISRVSDLLLHYRHIGRFQLPDAVSEEAPDAFLIGLFNDILGPTYWGPIYPGIYDLQSILAPFLFHKGSFRYNLVPQGIIGDANIYCTTYWPHDTNDSGALNFGVGGLIISNENKRIIELEVPYYCNEFFISNGEQKPAFMRIPQIDLIQYGSEELIIDQFVALGEDYTMGFPASIIPLRPYDDSS